MIPNYDLIDDFLPFGSMKATAGQNILLGVFLQTEETSKHLMQDKCF